MKTLKLRHVVLIISTIIIVDQVLKIWIKTTHPTGEVLRVLAALECGELCPANWSPGQATLVRPKDKEKAAPWETKEHVALR